MTAAIAREITFEPRLVYVEVGETVRWKLEHGAHTTTAYHPANDKPLRIPNNAEPWDSGLLRRSGTTFEQTFGTEGIYDYCCAAHEAMGMVGRVVVGDPDFDRQPGLAAPQECLPPEAQWAIRQLNHCVTTGRD